MSGGFGAGLVIARDVSFIDPSHISLKKKVIIVDDNHHLLRLLITSFRSKGFIAQGINNGKDALAYLLDEKNTEEICLLVLERMLPDMDGLDILHQFHAKFSKRVPTFVLSILSSEKEILNGLRKGAAEYIVKPFSLQIFMEKALALLRP